MAKQILFVQGAGKAAHDGWDDKLVQSLELALGAGYAIAYPRMPDEADPHYAPWKQELAKAIDALDDGAILIGHSLGGAFLVHLLAERMPKRRPAALMLIAAPFIGEGGWSSDEFAPRYDFAARLPVELPVFLYHGTADETVPFEHLDLYADALPNAITRPLEGRGHQLGDDLAVVAEDVRALG